MNTNEQNLTPAEVEALEALRTNCEATSVIEANGTEWRDVYLDNAKPAGRDGHAWAAVLGSLQKKGLYRIVDGWAWGSVLMPAKMESFELNCVTFQADAETLAVLRQVLPAAKETGDTSALQAVMELGLRSGRIVAGEGATPCAIANALGYRPEDQSQEAAQARLALKRTLRAAGVEIPYHALYDLAALQALAARTADLRAIAEQAQADCANPGPWHDVDGIYFEHGAQTFGTR